MEKRNNFFATIPILLNLAIVAIGPAVISRYMMISPYTTPIIASLPWIEEIGIISNDYLKNTAIQFIYIYI